MLRSEVGKNIAREREKKGLTKAQLAQKAGVTSRVMYIWESGSRCPSLEHLYALAEALRIPPQALLPQ